MIAIDFLLFASESSLTDLPRYHLSPLPEISSTWQPDGKYVGMLRAYPKTSFRMEVNALDHCSTTSIYRTFRLYYLCLLL